MNYHEEGGQRAGELIADPDIYRAAKLLIDQHGENAPLRAAERADQLLDAGDLEGAMAWRRILKAVEELTRGRREGGLSTDQLARVGQSDRASPQPGLVIWYLGSR